MTEKRPDLRRAARPDLPAWPAGSLLAGLPEQSRRNLLGLGVLLEYSAAGRVLIREGDPTTQVSLLLSGAVKVTGATPDGEALLAIRVGGDVVGELAALDGRPRLASVTTAGRVTVRAFSQAEFTQLLSRDPAVAAAVARSVGAKLRTATSRRIDNAGCDSLTRVARILLDLADRYGVQTASGKTIGCQLTQPELASLAAVAGPTAQRAIRTLKEEGLISTGYREIIVQDVAGLRSRASTN